LGQERHATFWFLKRLLQTYHIAYCFVPKPWLSRAPSVWVGQLTEWLRYSDHARLLVSVPDNDKSLFMCQ